MALEKIKARYRNKGTTAIGTVLGVLYYLQSLGVNLPKTWEEGFQLGVSVLIVGFGFYSKDATTGSRPERVRYGEGRKPWE